MQLGKLTAPAKPASDIRRAVALRVERLLPDVDPDQNRDSALRQQFLLGEGFGQGPCIEDR